MDQAVKKANNLQTVQIPISGNKVSDFVLVPFDLFKKMQSERQKLKEAVKKQNEINEVLNIIKEGEEEYRQGKTTTESLSSLMA